MLSKHLLIIFFVNIILNYIVLAWAIMKNKNNCICHNEKRLYIQFYSYFILMLIFKMFLLNVFDIICMKNIIKTKTGCDKKKYTFNYNDILLGISFIILLIFYIIISFIS